MRQGQGRSWVTRSCDSFTSTGVRGSRTCEYQRTALWTEDVVWGPSWPLRMGTPPPRDVGGHLQCPCWGQVGPRSRNRTGTRGQLAERNYTSLSLEAPREYALPGDRALPLQVPTPAFPAPLALGLCGLPPSRTCPHPPPLETLLPGSLGGPGLGLLDSVGSPPPASSWAPAASPPSPAPLTPLLRVSPIQAPVSALRTKESPQKT